MSETELPRWPAPWVRAALPTAVLAALEGGPLHGYAIAVVLSERGLGRPKGGSLYPLLTGLETEGAVAASWVQGESGPGRRTYALTPRGEARLADERRQWSALAAALCDPMPTEGRP